jgi:FixJ family two-component response regulator
MTIVHAFGQTASDDLPRPIANLAISGDTSPVAPIVFVVDDDAGVRRALARLIGSAGYCVQACASAGEFLSCAHSSERAACLVLDMRLPDFSGLELQRRLNSAGAAHGGVVIHDEYDRRAWRRVAADAEVRDLSW